MRTYDLAFKGGQFDYFRVLQSQRPAAEARLELNRALREAGEISGLLLEETWPPAAAGRVDRKMP